MDYDLCKKLKDAGFPQKTGEYASNASNCNCKTRGLVTSCHVAYIPTLSELIEACGNRLTILENWGDGWSAYEEEMDLLGIETKGKTLEEAVALLYLAIHTPPVTDSKDMIDHRCCPETNSPCGFEGKHRCCLCGVENSVEEETE
jgi:hypothetical protein